MMKIQSKRYSTFSPIEVTIRFETEEEINEFWHRMSISTSKLKTICQGVILTNNDDLLDPLFNHLDDLYTPPKE